MAELGPEGDWQLVTESAQRYFIAYEMLYPPSTGNITPVM